MERTIISHLVGAFVVTYLLAFVLRKVALHFDIVDVPGSRKVHKEPTPLLGGLAVMLGVLISLCLDSQLSRQSLPIFLGAVAILVVNLADDIKGLSARYRFGIEFVIALAVILSGVRISFLPPGPWGNLGEVIITLIWFVGLTNAFNYLDGMNGLAAGSAAINAFFFALILYWTGQPKLGILSFVLVGACLGFLPHNFTKAKMFLGDAGSTFLGFMLAGIAVAGHWAEDNVVKVSIPILILGVPIFDMTFTTLTRIKDRKVKTLMEWLAYAGKDHFHHYLVDLGFLPSGAVLFIWALTAALGLSAVMVSNDRAWEGILTVLQGSIILMIIGILMGTGKKHRGAGS